MTSLLPPYTLHIRYLYLDVVEFTRNRSIEAQSDIVTALNQLVKDSLATLDTPPHQVIYLPTGDGLGIAILDVAPPFDIHIQLALAILARVSAYNANIQDNMRRFEVRIGANENVDNVLLDINGNQNVAGAGINYAQRVMSVGDAGQLLVGQIVYETLSYRERYMKAFREYSAKVKHGHIIPVYQFIEEGHEGLVVDPPREFTPPLPQEHRLTELEAYYLAIAIKNRKFLAQESDLGSNSYALIVMLWFLANDAYEVSHGTSFNPPHLKIVGKGSTDLKSAFHYYKSIDFWVITTLADFVRDYLTNLEPYLEESFPTFYAVNDLGKKKLQEDFPDIVDSLQIDQAVA